MISLKVVKKIKCMLYDYRIRDGTSKFLVFSEYPIIRTFADSNKKLSPLRVQINRCVQYMLFQK